MPIKPPWPYTDVILRAHLGVNQWSKTINGKMHYFGVLSDPESARRRYLHLLNQQMQHAVDDTPPPRSEVTVNLVVNSFLIKRREFVESGEKSAGQFAKYRRAGDAVMKAFGINTPIESLAPSHFARLRASLKGNPTTIGNIIRDIRTIFRWGDAHFGVRPRFGDEFKKPSKSAMRKASRQRNLWTPAEIRTLITHASPAMRCFVLLGLNCGFGQGDCSAFTRQVFNLEAHWMPRGKNDADRRCPLWPATVAALCDYDRPRAMPGAGAEGLFFVTRLGRQWVTETMKRDVVGVPERTTYKDNISQNLRKFCKRIGVEYRPFYTFRHTFRSVADDVGDDTAINVIMGHSAGGMKAVYTQMMANRMERLRKVTDHVLHWLQS
jgi:integrase